LIGRQQELVDAMLATGKPVIALVFNGRPLSINSLAERVPVVFECWYLGQECGHAVADVLFGDHNPGGKLPISFPRSAGHVPVFYGHKTSGGRSHWKGDYVDGLVTPLYPFGHGLSYTTFALSDAAVASPEVSWRESVVVSVAVTNTGARRGDEVVQLYARRPRASVTRPVLELKGFKRVAVEPGQRRTVTFEVPAGQLGFYDHDMEFVVEPGEVELLVGQSSADLVEAGSVTIVPAATPPVKAFDGVVTIE
jgi:beta-glucosidase